MLGLIAFDLCLVNENVTLIKKATCAFANYVSALAVGWGYEIKWMESVFSDFF